jgi:hypothetical protein
MRPAAVQASAQKVLIIVRRDGIDGGGDAVVNDNVALVGMRVHVSDEASYSARCVASAFSIFLSVLYWLRAYTDQIAAGTHPMRVSCSSRHRMPAKGRPMVKNWNQGKKIANNRRTSFPFNAMSQWQASGLRHEPARYSEAGLSSLPRSNADIGPAHASPRRAKRALWGCGGRRPSMALFLFAENFLPLLDERNDLFVGYMKRHFCRGCFEQFGHMGDLIKKLFGVVIPERLQARD